MATTTTFLQHPLHDNQHPLELWDFRNGSITPYCDLCDWEILSDGYACEECYFFVHRACTHPLHADHPLTLIHQRPHFHCDACDNDFHTYFSSFRCDDCDFELDVRCALSTLSDRGGTQGKTPEQIKLQLHIHPLTSFSTRHDFIEDINCVICKARVKGDGYACLHWECEFLIHNRCIGDLYYTDGTKAPRIYHRHPLKTFLGKDKDFTRCANCASYKLSGEFIGCAECQLFYCRDCVQVPKSIQYPHHPDHTLVLLINSPNKYRPQRYSCYYLKCDLGYGCPSCEFFVDVGCAARVLSYCEEGMSTEIDLSWHKHSLLLCHITRHDRLRCSNCENMPAGPMYTCKEKGCEFLLHKRCTEIESTIIHPHHTDHPLTLCNNEGDYPRCGACSETIHYLQFCCELCAFYLHAKCAARFPTRKHSLHEHELLHLC